MAEEKVIPEWYKKPEVDEEARNIFYEKRSKLQYREVTTEIPAKMLLELGKIAKDKGIGFNNFIEDILEQYLESQGIKWREAPDNVGEWEKYI